MNLDTLIGSGAKPYLEYGWVCAPNAAGQSITANTVTTLTVDTEVADSGNYGSVASNQITLASGTYYFKAQTPVSSGAPTDGGRLIAILSLFNSTSSSYITRSSRSDGYATNVHLVSIEGQFTISSSSVFELRLLGQSYQGTLTIGEASQYVALTNSTAGLNQRTTIKLWKLA
jgi:hypothetical protein